ncbi:hypothetical protein [Trichothermofontia sp.]
MNNHPLIPAFLLSITFLGNVGCEKANSETAIGATPKPGLESQSQPNGQVPLMGTNGATPNPDLESQYQRIRAEIQARQAPVRPPSTVFIGVDQSGSMGFSRIATATYGDIKPVLDALAQNGGTIAVGKICDRSDVPLVRTSFAEPPRLGNLPAIGDPPVRPKTDRGDPFHIQKQLKQYEFKSS